MELDNQELEATQHRGKTGDELFKELGYEKIEDNDVYIIYRLIDMEIVFWKDDNIFSKDCYIEKGYFTMEELKAINKKVEELKWK
jgi:hypothetical protein